MTRRLLGITIFLTLIFAAVFTLFQYEPPSSSVSASTIIVDINGGGNYSSIQAAINNANPGDTVYVWAGNYNEDLSIGKKLNLIGNSTKNTTITGTGWGDVIYITGNSINVSGFKVTTTNTSMKYAGIKLDQVQNCYIFENNCSNNYDGIELKDSNSNTIRNNDCDSNEFGISLVNSDLNVLINNSCNQNNYNGIYIVNSISNVLMNNSMKRSDLGLYGNKISCWDTHTISDNNSVNGQPIYYWKKKKAGTVPTGAGQVILANCSNVVVEDQILVNGSTSITLGYSDYSIIRNNVCNYNLFYGIYLYLSDSNVVEDNTCSANANNGIYIYDSEQNSISNNTCSNNQIGVNIFHSYNNKIINNSCNLNDNGIFVRNYADNNKIINNTCKFNSDDGIQIDYSQSVFLINNTCNQNFDAGIAFADRVRTSHIITNTCLANYHGLYIIESSWNNFEGNNISLNLIGSYLNRYSNYNRFIENQFISNSVIGIEMDTDCNHNIIYHNNFIKNQLQARDQSINDNNWDYLNEGNYWSDYLGFDNGFNNRTAADGIGDTKIPHCYDNYPFMNLSGWLYPAQPIITGLKYIDDDGNYSLYWDPILRTDGYFLEEDDNAAFKSPTVYTDGWDLIKERYKFEVSNRPEGKYFYRVCGFNEVYQGSWSEVVNTTVAYRPITPANLKASAYPDGNGINVSWVPNQNRTAEYILQYSTKATWNHLGTVKHPAYTFNHSNLADGKSYYYRICARDIYGRRSEYSRSVTGIPKDSMPPKPPTGLNASAISDSTVLLTWTANSEPDLEGYQIYMNTSASNEVEEFKLIYTITGNITHYIVTGLVEQITYDFRITAYDEIPNYSNYSEIAPATPPDETYPETPKGLAVSNPTLNSLTITWKPNPDLDIIGYVLYRSLSLNGPYFPIEPELITGMEYIDSDLDDGTIYYYKLKAVDDANQSSKFSNFAYGVTLFGPRPPMINNTISDLSILEDSDDYHAINLFYLFYDVNNDVLTFRCEGSENITVNINQDNGKVVVYAKSNWNGVETLTFYANDSIFETAYNITITVSGVNDAPEQPVIIAPINGFETTEGTNLTLLGKCNDPDLIYGDLLYFNWSSNIIGSLGEGKCLENIYLPAGQHLITLEVSDHNNRRANTTVYVSILAQEKTKSIVQDDNTNLIITATAGVFIVIETIILCFMVLKKIKQSKSVKDKKAGDESLAKKVQTKKMPGNTLTKKSPGRLLTQGKKTVRLKPLKQLSILQERPKLPASKVKDKHKRKVVKTKNASQSN